MPCDPDPRMIELGMPQGLISKAQTEPVYPGTPSAEIMNSNLLLAPWPVGALYLVRPTSLPQDPCPHLAVQGLSLGTVNLVSRTRCTPPETERKRRGGLAGFRAMAYVTSSSLS